MTERELTFIATLTAERVAINTKEHLTIPEAAMYIGRKVSFIRSLISPRLGKMPIIDSYTINGYKDIYIKRTDLDSLIESNVYKKSISTLDKEVDKIKTRVV